jgi:hypothetical protein
MTEFLEFAKTYGLPMALVVVFIYWSWKRENQLAAKLNEVETYVRSTLGDALIKSTEAINRSTDVLSQVLDELKFRDRNE